MLKQFTDEHYNLMWEENFKYSSFVDDCAKNWNVINLPAGTHNQELQKFVDSSENVFVKDGKLHMVAQQFLDGDTVGYTSACLTTMGKREFKYGKFEIRLKYPVGNGLIPFFRLAADQEKHGKWPQCGQLDILMSPTATPTKHYSSVHYGQNVMSQGVYTFQETDNVSTGFHNYVCEWEPGVVRFFVDDVMFFETILGDEFEHPFFLELGLAVGGVLAGPPTEATVFGKENPLVIEYIKVYKKENYVKPLKAPLRKPVIVCGSWDDAKNLHIFLNSFQTPEYKKRYVTEVFALDFSYKKDRDLEEEKFINYISKSNPAAIVVFVEMVKSDAIVEAFKAVSQKQDIPMFVFEKPYDGVINVRLDYGTAFEKICRHVIEEHGVKDVEMFAGRCDNTFSEEREKIFLKILEENGIDTDNRIHFGSFIDYGASFELERLLSDPNYKVPRAYICANDDMAKGLMLTLRKHGYRIPEDVMITGLDGVYENVIFRPKLATAKPDYSEFGHQFIKIIDRWHEEGFKEKVLSEDIAVNFNVKLKGTCGCECEESIDALAESISYLANSNDDNYRHIYSMNTFVNLAIGKDDYYSALAELSKVLWLWTNQYYLVGMQGADDKIKILFYRHKGKYKYDQRYVNLDGLLPEMDTLLEADSGVDTLFIKPIDVQEDIFVFAVTGVINPSFRDEQRFEELVLFLSSVFNSVYNNQNYIKISKSFEQMSERDYLTGLYNRRGFLNEINRKLRLCNGIFTMLSIFSIDMDGLKQINDNFGHDAGDEAIKFMAEVLRTYAGANGVCARYGGDEFAIAIISHNTVPINIEQVHKDIDEIIENVLASVERPYKISASVGCSQRIVDENFNYEDLIREADINMYADKEKRKKQRKV